MSLKGTTIVAVKRNGKCAIAGDGQVTLGEKVVMKGTAKKVRRLITTSGATATCTFLRKY